MVIPFAPAFVALCLGATVPVPVRAADPATERDRPADEASPAADEADEPALPAVAPEPALEERDDLLELTPRPAPGATTISLRSAVAEALSRNYGILDSTDSVQSSQQLERAAEAEFYPELTPRFDRSRDLTVFGLGASQRLPWLGGTLEGGALFRSGDALIAPTHGGDFRLSLVQPLLRGAGPTATHYQEDNARRAREGQERNLQLARQRLVVQVTQSFYSVIAQRTLVAVARQSLRRSEALLRASKARLEVGLVSKLDVFRAELQAAQTQDALVRSEAALEAALESFRALLALAPSDPLEPEAQALPEGPPGGIESIGTLLARALEQRLDLQELRDQIEDGRRTLRVASLNLLPDVRLGFFVERSGRADSYWDTWTTGIVDSGFTLQASYPLQRSNEKTARALAELSLASRERALRQREEQIEAEVRSAVRELERIDKSVELQRKGVEAAAQQRRLAVLRYQRGLGSNFDVVDAEGSFLLARSALVSLLVSRAVASAELERVTGVLATPSRAQP